MSPQTQVILEAVLALPETEREFLLARVLQSLSPEGVEMTDEEFHAELDRRHAEFEKDPRVGIPWTDVLEDD